MNEISTTININKTTRASYVLREQGRRTADTETLTYELFVVVSPTKVKAEPVWAKTVPVWSGGFMSDPLVRIIRHVLKEAGYPIGQYLGRDFGHGFELSAKRAHDIMDRALTEQ